MGKVGSSMVMKQCRAAAVARMNAIWQRRGDKAKDSIKGHIIFANI